MTVTFVQINKYPKTSHRAGLGTVWIILCPVQCPLSVEFGYWDAPVGDWSGRGESGQVILCLNHDPCDGCLLSGTGEPWRVEAGSMAGSGLWFGKPGSVTAARSVPRMELLAHRGSAGLVESIA